MTGRAFGEQNPTQGEGSVSWQTWSNGAGTVPTVYGDADWGKLILDLSGEEARSAVYDLGETASRTFAATANRYGSGTGTAILEIRGGTSAFAQDDASPSWDVYSGTVSYNWRYVQIRERTFTTYYVDATGGDDDNTGISTDQAWQTIAKVNAATFQPGDQVLFKRGETWSGTRLLPASSGAAGNPIVYADYGTGALPIITSTSAVAAEVVRVVGLGFVTFRNLHIVTTTCDYGVKLLLGTHDCILDSCVCDGGAINAVYITGNPTTAKNFLVTNCEILNATTMGLQVYSASAPARIDNVIVEYCTIHDNGTSTTTDHGAYFHWATNSIMRYNTSYNNATGGLKMNSCVSCEMHHNKSYGNRVGLIIGGDPTTSAGNNLIYDNLVYANGDGIDILGLATSNLIYHNTVVNPTEAFAGGIALAASGGESPASNTFKNNIIHCDSDIMSSAAPLLAQTQAQVEAQTWDYNDWWWANRGDTVIANIVTYRTWAQFKAFSGSPEVHGINISPEFVTDYTDLHLQATSDCIAAGEAGLVTDDYDGVTRGAAADIGAYEYVA